jgi:hypothetical protein
MVNPDIRMAAIYTFGWLVKALLLCYIAKQGDETRPLA